jgi:alanine racemase
MLETVCERPAEDLAEDTSEKLSASELVTREPKIVGRPVWAEVRLGALDHNLRAIRAHLDTGRAGQSKSAPRVKILAVVKANAYGHGAVATAKALARAGADTFCVTCSAEGIELRESGIKQPILLLTGFWPGEEKRIIENRLTPAVTDCSQLKLLERAAARAARKLRGPLDFHWKIDSGMNRLGASPASVECFARALAECKHLRLAGTFTHFASSEVFTTSETSDQTRVFLGAIAHMKQLGMNPGIVHMANSAAIISRPETWADAVRPGAILYGYHQNYDPPERNAIANQKVLLQPAMSFRARIISVRDVPAGAGVGYNAKFHADCPSRVGILAAGYADGIPRDMGNRGKVLVRGQFAPVIGSVSMDLTAVDLTGIPDVQHGDVATIYGTDGGTTQRAFDVARQLGLVTAQVLVGLGWRVPRIYER